MTDKTKKVIWFFIGLLAVVAGFIPFFILKDKSVFLVRDQLDGAVTDYLLSARHLFQRLHYLPEALSGFATNQLNQRSPLSVVFYFIPDLFAAYISNYIFMTVTAYVSMFFLCDRLKIRVFFATVAAVLFAYMPLFMVYGLCGFGIPLVVLAYLMLRDEGFKAWKAYFLLILYVAFSSLALVGYAVIIVWGIGLLCSLFNKTRRKNFPALFVGEVLITGIYAVINYSLIAEVLFHMGEAIHRAEFKRMSDGIPFFETVEEILTTGGDIELRSWPLYMLIASLAVCVLLSIFKKKAGDEASRKVRAVVRCLVIVVAIAAFAGVVKSPAGVKTLDRIGGAIASFQWDRFFYFMPTVGCVCFAFAMDALTEMGRGLSASSGKKLPKVLVYCVCATCIAVCAFNVFWKSVFKTNLREVISSAPSNSLTWHDFFAKEQLADINAFIEENYGLKQDEYRIGNLGLEPAITLASGFYTIDGYSNSYPLSYKKTFRQIIAKELDKNDTNRIYFDDWGNRCYLFASGYYGNPFLSRYEHAVFSDLELNIEQLKALNCKFIFAAGEIVGAEEKGYKLALISDYYDSSYVIYVYEII